MKSLSSPNTHQINLPPPGKVSINNLTAGTPSADLGLAIEQFIDKHLLRTGRIIKDSDRLIRLREVLKIIPVSKSCWLAWVAAGKAPSPIRLGGRCTCWKYADIVNFTANRGA